MKNKFLIILILVIALLIISACSPQINEPLSAPEEKTLPAESANPEDTPLPSAENIILINNFVFEPQELIVKTGTEITWENNHNVVHTIVSSGLFESEVLNKGESFSFTFTNPGEYNYYCGIHPSMTGTVLVK
ncbi:MAG TPA: cupredoxin domain-containing protein [Candidatus Nanoarchaeia archaeon]|nr:cupredoxin domain-containing protein [Candidatus Nanoarchaeia archaeon]